MPCERTAGEHFGASASYTELGPPDRMMPEGSNLRISSTAVVHGRMALKTFCSRILRAMSCVYWPPKSSTTTPPRSDCGFRCSSCSFAPVVMAGSGVMLLGYKEIEEFVRDVNSFYDAVSVEMRRGGGGLPGHLHDGIFFCSRGRFSA